MEHDEATKDDRENRRTATSIVAAFALIAVATILPGPLAILSGVIGGTILGREIFCECFSNADNAAQPIAESQIAPQDDAIPLAALELEPPSPSERWADRMARTAAGRCQAAPSRR